MSFNDKPMDSTERSDILPLHTETQMAVTMSKIRHNLKYLYYISGLANYYIPLSIFILMINR